MKSILLLVLSLVATCQGTYYLPGVTPHTYRAREPVKLLVNKLTSTKTQMPFDYYSLPYCLPGKMTMESENLGEVLSGDRIENSVYKLEMKSTKSCVAACGMKLSKTQKQSFIDAIEDDYRVHWMVDNLPVGMMVKNDATGTDTFVRGFPVGHMVKEGKLTKHYVNNHVRITIQYHDDVGEDTMFTDEEATTKIVGFRVQPMSVRHQWDAGEYVQGKSTLSTCFSVNSDASVAPFSVDKGSDNYIVYTYDIAWEKSDTEWTNRWDLYLNANSPDEKVHFFSITNSMTVVLFLTVMIAMILLRALRKDIAQYNDPSTIEDAKEESGWKLVHGDVFRPPTTSPMLFSVFVGTGVQLGCMSVATLSFALLGLLSPANRGSLVTAFILLFVFMGSFAGYYSSSVYKMFRGIHWKQNTLTTAFLFPGVVFSVMLMLNLVLWYRGSSGAIPFGAFFSLLFLWFCVSVPLVFLGSFFGYKRESPSFPVRTNQIPRAIPQQSWFMSPVIAALLGGILPFGAVSVELYFIMSALWLHQIYYIFGFLFLVMIVLVVTCAEVSILLCYFQLCSEDYHWWWRSFLTAGSCAFYTLVYAAWYNLTELEMHGLIPMMIYFGYMALICFGLFLVTGTIGYMSCFWFNNKIYGSIKVD